MGWDRMGWMGGWMGFVVAGARFEREKILGYMGRHGGTWTGTYLNGVPKCMSFGTYRFVVLCTGYGYVPAAGVAVTESENVPLARP